MNNDSIRLKAEKALEKVRTYLQKDNGDIDIVNISDEMELTVRFVGACSHCNINYQTFKFGVEPIVREELPEIKTIVAIDERNNPYNFN